MYQDNKQKDPSKEPWYQIYTLNDFKKMQKEVRLNRGTLASSSNPSYSLCLLLSEDKDGASYLYCLQSSLCCCCCGGG
jgi:hypothetical protein